MLRPPAVLLAAQMCAALGSTAVAQSPATSSIVGSVAAEDGRRLDGARVRAQRTDRRDTLSRETTTDDRGEFRLGGLPSGSYTVTARAIGYRAAELPSLRLATGQTTSLRVTLTAAAQQLSAIVVVTSGVAIDAGTTELPATIDRQAIALLPTGRDASSLIALVPGARGDQLWGGAAAAANNYKLDGIAVNHPGTGGDFLRLPVDWIEALEVRGLGAGVEHGNFQGGIVNAVTRTGTNTLQGAIRTNYESPRLTATNLTLNEQGSEQAGRHEVTGELLGPVLRDRLFFFVAGQSIQRDVRAPNLATLASSDFQNTQENHHDGRGLGKLTWLPAAGERVDLLVGGNRSDVAHAGLNGVDDPTATAHDVSSTVFYEAEWTAAHDARNTFELKVGGFTGSESQLGYGGANVPAVQVLQLGRQPTYQNSIFDERIVPSSVAGSAIWHSLRRALGAEHQLLAGGEVERTGWRDDRVRNGGLTWRPYTSDITETFDPTDSKTWATVGSDWGGDVHIDSDAENDAAFLQDQMAIGTRLTAVAGVRYGRWSAWLTPQCGTTCAPRFLAVRASAIDPRLGVAWDVTGRNDFALKLHWGRYHQGMYPLFFDRAQGANVYSNERFYYLAPPLADPRTPYTPQQRDAYVGAGGFSVFYNERILNESGRVDGYRQPYVDQTALSAEKAIGARWKAELLYTYRANGDIVGLVDRNLATNYTELHNIRVSHRLGFGDILDANGHPLVLQSVFIANNDLVAFLELPSRGPPVSVAGITGADIPHLHWNQDILLTTIPDARRRYDQLTFSLRTIQPSWRADGSVTGIHLRGNVAGIAGHGTAGSQFTAGPFVRPNESINFFGALPDASELEAKVWLTTRVSRSVQAGLLYTHVLGERFTPTFQLDGRYLYRQADGTDLPGSLFNQVLGQTIFVEPRGSRTYASRTILDAHAEWSARIRSRPGFVLTADLFNLTGSQAILNVKTTIDDQAIADPTSYLGAPRLRVSPRTLRLGLRVE
jgi:hypothetical protein